MDVEHGLARMLTAVHDDAVTVLGEAFSARIFGCRQRQLADQVRLGNQIASQLFE